MRITSADDLPKGQDVKATQRIRLCPAMLRDHAPEAASAGSGSHPGRQVGLGRLGARSYVNPRCEDT